MLRAQVQIEAARRPYNSDEQESLHDLFGEPARWGRTLKTFLWTHASVVVPSFQGSTTANLPVPCSFDFNVAATKYFAGLEGGEVPVCVQFSGTVFYSEDGGVLQVMPIPWDKEVRFRLPVKLWKELMDTYYPGVAWLCLERDAFQRLLSLQGRARHSHLGASAGEPASRGRRGSEIVNTAAVAQIAKAVLYEGYMLYPYRPSAVKNQQRFNFGVVYPQAFSEAQKGTEPYTMTTECLVEGTPQSRLEVRVRFLQLVDRSVEQCGAATEFTARSESLIVGDRHVLFLARSDRARSADSVRRALPTFSFRCAARDPVRRQT